ncbi:hypothetical protein LUZ60_003948 [Juncus effusus]|nr:hypothetical protein LUZ60_003948 [Juncus effusus]
MLSSDTDYSSWKTSWQKREDDMIGFDKYFEALKEKLIGGSERREVIHIEGECGIGKTTLAKKVYNDVEIRRHFEVCIWLHMPLNDESDDVIHAQIRENLLAFGLEIEEETSTRSIERCISNCLQDKRYIVMLDDLSHFENWACVYSILPDEFNGSRVVVVARPGTHVPRKAYSETLSLGYLSKDDSKSLFCQRAFSSFDWPVEYADISSEDIHDMTRGHPLTILLLSGFLNPQLPPSMWREILTWSLKFGRDVDRDRILSLSFDNLPNNVKPCFLYFAGFPMGTVFSTDKLVRLWDAEGFIELGNEEKFVEEIGKGILEELILRRLVHPVRKDRRGHIKEVVLHDLVYDFVQSEARNNNFLKIRTDTSYYPAMCRRLFLQNCIYKDLIFLRKMRSLSFYFEEPFWRKEFSNLSFLRSARFLRVLDMQGLSVKRIPEEIGNMILLRYLGVGSRELTELPSSIKNLINLQTLDIAFTSVTNLASGFWNIPTLKHVFGSLLVVPPRVGCLVNLLTLRNINCSNWNPVSYNVLHNMSHLKSLELRGLLRYDPNALLSSLGKLNFLEHLILAGKDLPLRLFAISTISRLETLELHGTLDSNLGVDTIPNMCSNLPLLNTVRLFSSNATQTLVDALALLPNLFILEMNKAYNGQELAFCAKGFYRLKELELLEMDELRTCRIDASCMPQLEKLTMLRCSNVRMPPYGLSNLKKLKEVTICYPAPACS